MVKFNKIFGNLYEVINVRKEERKKGIRFIDLNGKDLFLSYSEIFEDSVKILTYIKEAGIKTGDKVILMVKNNLDFIPAFWACVYGGVAVAPLAFTGITGDIERFCRVTESMKDAFVLTDKDIMNCVMNYASKNGIDLDYLNKRFIYTDEMRHAQTQNVGVNVASDTLAIIQFSSGTTGIPKGVLLTHQNIIDSITDLTQRVESTPEDVCLSWLPLTFDMGLIACHMLCVLVNEQQILMPTQDFLRSPDFWLKSVQKYKAEYLFCSNSALLMTRTKIEQKDNFQVDLSSVKIIFCGGELITADSCENFYHSFKQYGIRDNTILTVYGMAEATVGISTPYRGEKYVSVKVDTRSLTVGSIVEYCEEMSPFALEMVDCGYPLEGISVKIGDLYGSDLGEDRFGIIHLKGSYVTQGYYNTNNKDKKFLKDGWFQTSDYGFFHNGRLVVAGRMDDAVIMNGQNYYISDFERVLKDTEGLEGMSFVICKIRDGQNKTDDIAVFFVIESFETMNIVFEKISKIKESLALYAMIKVQVIIPVYEIPVSQNGKVNKKQLVDDFVNGKYEEIIIKINQHFTGCLENDCGSTVSDKTQDDVLTKLLDLWEEITGYHINDDDSLLVNGIDSIAANDFVFRIQSVFNIDINITDMFYCKTMEEVYQLIINRMGDQ